MLNLKWKRIAAGLLWGSALVPATVVAQNPSAAPTVGNAPLPSNANPMLGTAQVPANAKSMVGSGKGSANANPVVALVNGEPITLAEVDAVLRQRPTSLTPLTTAQQRQLRLEAVSGLIDDLLLRQYFHKHGAKIAPAEVDKQLAQVEVALKQQGKTLQDFYRESHQTEAQVRSGILATLQMTQYIRQKANEADLKKYFQENKDYFDKTTVRARHIVIRLPQGGTPSEREQAKQKLTALREQIVAGKIDFAEAAKKHSHCPSAPQGGDIGFFTRKWMLDEEFAKAAFAMKPGEISGVVETEFGVHLIQVTERNAGTPANFEQCLEDVRDCFMEDTRQALLAQLRKTAQVSITLP